MSHERFLVTGALGCIGAWVVKVLLERGLDVVIYDADPNPARLSLLLPPEQLEAARQFSDDLKAALAR